MKRLGWSVARILCAVLGVGVSAGAGALLVQRFAQRDGPARAAVAIAPVKAMVSEEEVTPLRREVARLQWRLELLEGAGAERNDAQCAGTTAEPASPEHSLTRDHAPPKAIDPYEYRDQLQRDWEEQTLDPDWAEVIETELIAAFDADALSGSQLLGAQCGSSLCRVEYAHDNALARLHFRSGVPALPAFQGAAAFGLPTDEQQLQYVLFMTRKGEALPEPE